MKAVTKYRRKPLFRILSICVLTLLAGLALAPGYALNAKVGKLLAGGNKADAVAAPSAQPKTTAPHPYTPYSDKTAPDGESRGEQAPAEEPQQTGGQSEFDGETTFAVDELGHGYAGAESPRFAALGGGSGGGSAGGSAKIKQQPAASSPTQTPHVGVADSHRDTTSSGPDSTNPGDLPVDEKPRDDTNPNGLPVASVPEPSSIALLAIGLLGLACARRFYS